MSSQSRSYELLVAELHQALITADGVTTVVVDHDKTIVGRSGATHQIDVYWEFRLAGSLYRTCIECKQYTSKVKKSHIAAFAGVIDDIGNATGIFATTVGYQKGALLLAKHTGIRPVLVNPLLREISIKYHFQMPQITVTSIEFDPEHARAKIKDAGITEYSEELHITEHDPVFDSEGRKISTINQLIRRHGTDEGSHTLAPEDQYLDTQLGHLRLKSVAYSVVNTYLDMEDHISNEHAAKAILEDVLNNTACYLNSDGTIHV